MGFKRTLGLLACLVGISWFSCKDLETVITFGNGNHQSVFTSNTAAQIVDPTYSEECECNIHFVNPEEFGKWDYNGDRIPDLKITETRIYYDVDCDSTFDLLKLTTNYNEPDLQDRLQYRFDDVEEGFFAIVETIRLAMELTEHSYPQFEDLYKSVFDLYWELYEDVPKDISQNLQYFLNKHGFREQGSEIYDIMWLGYKGHKYLPWLGDAGYKYLDKQSIGHFSDIWELNEEYIEKINFEKNTSEEMIYYFIRSYYIIEDFVIITE